MSSFNQDVPKLIFTNKINDDGYLQRRTRLQEWDISSIDTFFSRITHAVAVVCRRRPEPVKIAFSACVIWNNFLDKLNYLWRDHLSVLVSRCQACGVNVYLLHTQNVAMLSVKSSLAVSSLHKHTGTVGYQYINHKSNLMIHTLNYKSLTK